MSAPAEHAERIVRIANDQGSQIYINIAGPAAPESSPAPDLSSSAPEGIAQMVKREAREMRVDPQLVDAVIRVESGYNPRAVSSKGAMGLMQLIPATADRFGVRNPFDPAQNVAGGVSYLRYLLNLFHGNVPLSVAAYNAGEHLVLRTGRVPAIPETVNYVRKVTALYSVPDNKGGAAPTPEAPIVSAVDAQGVIHFSNDGAF
ncbi:MAG: lytic transglycosylase domain-containing protein [Terriglobia bacterium]